jgi:opacity protein-like surface antigen
MRKLIIAALVALGVAAGVSAADAAPIVCPGGQQAVNQGAGNFLCVNNGGNADQSGMPKH